MLTSLTVLKPRDHLFFTRLEGLKPRREFLQSKVQVAVVALDLCYNTVNTFT
jgi:hypothetical protein